MSTPPHEPLMQRRHALRRLYAASFGGFGSFYLLIAAVPARGAAIGGALAAGALTFVFLAATVGAQLTMPRLTGRFRPAPLLVAALLLLGIPAFVYPRADGMFIVGLLTALRGLGFGILTVLGSFLVAAYAGSRRARALGTLGLVTGALGIFGPAIGLAAYRSSHPSVAFVAAGALPVLMTAALVRGLPESTLEEQAPVAHLRGLGLPLLLPLIAFAAPMAGLGAVYSFLPLRAAGHATLALLVFGVAYVGARHGGGRIAWSPGRNEEVTLGLVAATAGGLIAVAWAPSLAALLAGTLLIGLGTGGLCTTTLVTLFERGGRRHAAAVSVVWNVCYDAAVAAGGLVLGVLARGFGVHAAFAVAGVVVIGSSLPAAVVDARTTEATGTSC